MEEDPKPKPFKSSETPEMTRLKNLTDPDVEGSKPELADVILKWLRGEPNADPIVPKQSLEEVRANLLLPPFEIELGHDSQVSRWRSWLLHKRKAARYNDLTESIAEAYAKGRVTISPEQLRDVQLEAIAVDADELDAPGLRLELAKELRAGIDGKTKALHRERALAHKDRDLKIAEEKWLAEKEEKLDAAFAELGKEAKGNAEALKYYELFKAALRKA